MSLVPNEKNSADSAILSATSDARDVYKRQSCTYSETTDTISFASLTLSIKSSLNLELKLTSPCRGTFRRREVFSCLTPISWRQTKPRFRICDLAEARASEPHSHKATCTSVILPMIGFPFLSTQSFSALGRGFTQNILFLNISRLCIRIPPAP